MHRIQRHCSRFFPNVGVLQAGLVILAILSAGASAQESAGPTRYKVAVLDFEIIAIGVEAPENLGRAMSAAFNNPLVESYRFTVIERNENLEKLFEEIQLNQQGVTNQDRELTFGQVPPLDLFITGTITITSTGINVTAKFTEVPTGRLIVAPEAKGELAELTRIARELVAAASDLFPLQGAVLEVNELGVFIDLGTNSGLSLAAVGRVYRELIIAGRSLPRDIGVFEVVEIGPTVSRIVVTLNDEVLPVQQGDIVSIQSLDEPTRPLRNAEASLSLQGAPSNALVFIDDELRGDLGQQPLILHLDPGDHTLRVEAAGFRTYEQRLSLNPGEERSVPITLLPLVAVLEFRVDAAEYSVSIGNVEHGAISEVELEPGTYEILISAPGRQSERLQRSLGPEERQVVEVALAWSPNLRIAAPIGTIVVATSAEGASRLPELDEPSRTYGIPPGRYRLELSAPNGTSYSAEADIRVGVMHDIAFPGFLSVVAPENMEVVVSSATEEVYRGAAPEDLELPGGRYEVRLVEGGESREVVLQAAETTRIELAPPQQAEVPQAESPQTEVPQEEAPQAAAPQVEEPPPDTNSGTLIIRSNLIGAVLLLEGTEKITIPLEGEVTEARIPPGLYLATATGLGARQIDETVFIGAAEEVELLLEFDFEPIRLEVANVMREDVPILQLRVLGATADRYSARIEGPENWNAGTPIEAQLARGGNYEWKGELQLSPGEYVISLVENPEDSGGRLRAEIDVPPSSFPPPNHLEVDQGSDLLRLHWPASNGLGNHYLVVLGTSGQVLFRKLVSAEEVREGAVELDPVLLRQASVLAICLTRNRQEEGNAPIFFVTGESSCLDVVSPGRQRPSSPGGNPGDGPGTPGPGPGDPG